VPENDRLNGILNEIELGFVGEATPKLLMKLGVPVYFAILLFQYLFCFLGT